MTEVFENHQPRPILPQDLAGLHALNEAHARETSSMSPEAFAKLLGEALLARAAGPEGAPEALLVALDATADYDSPNFLWFRARGADFAYVDRVIVSAKARGAGLARRLYADLFAVAKETGLKRVVCEVNSDPPNPASDAFHAALGFREVGSARLEDRGKTVRYLERLL
ncbi:GNAT family N-acetyltransferase [Neomegalonema perideroedes]|uniref:GNAT family N-acetyltransferase n=1 Tax=Neomegalonema perideroedes TaxID=217219 RepID=UPI0003601FF3|nr:GNAT family N-acetyltransferase [Neomegalonema perideroedes]